MKMIKQIIFCIIIFGYISCNQEQSNFLFGKRDLFLYDYSFKDKSGEIKIEISYDKKLSEELGHECFNFKSPFFNSKIYLDNRKIFLFNKQDRIHSVLFDFQGKIKDENIVCLNKAGSCFKYTLDSINYDETLMGNVFVYKVKQITDNKLPITSAHGIENIYINEEYGIIRITEKSGLGLITYNLKN